MLVGIGGTAFADDAASIDHMKLDGARLEVLLSVPGTGEVDLSTASVQIDGQDVTATAEDAADSDLRRTSVLAFDTSNSMAGAKFTQAKAAALSYLDAVPDNVYVGMVTFDDSVDVVREPTLNRDEMRTAIGGLKLAESTALNQGVIKAVTTTGTRARATCSSSPTASTRPRHRCRACGQDQGALGPRWTWSRSSSPARDWTH